MNLRQPTAIQRLEGESLLAHFWLRRLVSIKEYHINYKKEFFSDEVASKAFIDIIEEENDDMFDLLLKNHEKGSFSLMTICSILTNCFKHLKMLDYSIFLDKPIQQDDQISLVTIFGHQRKQYKHNSQRLKYLEFFGQLTKDFSITHVAFKYGKDALMVSYYSTLKSNRQVAGFSVVRKNPVAIDIRKQVRVEILSSLFKSYFLATGFAKTDAFYAEAMMQCLSRIEEVQPSRLIRTEGLIERYRKVFLVLFEVLNHLEEDLDQDTTTLVMEYLENLLCLLNSPEVIFACFDTETDGMLRNAAAWIESQGNFKLYSSFSSFLLDCDEKALVLKGERIMNSFFKKHGSGYNEDLKYFFQMMFNLGQGLNQVNEKKYAANCLMYLITQYSRLKQFIGQEKDEDYLKITTTLMRIYIMIDQEKLKVLRKIIIQQQTPHYELFVTGIDAHLDTLTKEQAKKKLTDLNKIYSSQKQNHLISSLLLLIAHYVDEKKVTRNIHTGSLWERFNHALSYHQFDLAEKLYDDHKEELRITDEYTDLKAVLIYQGLKKYEKIEQTVDLIRLDSIKGTAFWSVAHRLGEEQNNLAFQFLQKALDFKSKVSSKSYYEMIYAGLNFSLKFNSEENKSLYLQLATDVPAYYRREWAKEIMNNQYRDQRNFILDLAQSDVLIIEECYRNYKRLLPPSQPEDDMTWMVNGKLLNQKEEMYCFEDGIKVKKYGYIDPKLENKIGKFQEFKNALKSGVAQKALGKDGVKFVYSKSRGSYSGHKIKIGDDCEIYGNTVIVKTDTNGIEHQLYVFDKYGNHQGIKNYFALNLNVIAMKEKGTF